MPLKGSGFLAIWHDIRAEGEPEYNLWHTREHMPERLGVPGFESGRRYVDWNLAEHRYFTLYEARSTLVSVGKGIGGAIATIRVNLTSEAGKGAFAARSHALVHEIMPLDGVTSVHIGLAEPTVARVQTRESELPSRAGTCLMPW